MTGASTLAVEATGLVKAFGATRAVDGIDLTVPTGSVYGFLGPNGAGKTTTIRMLATLLRPDAGQPGCSATTWSRNRPRCATGSASPGSTPRSTRR